MADLAGSPEKQAQPQCCGLTTAQEVGLAEAPVVALAGGLEQQARLLWCRLTAAQVVGLAEALEQQAQLSRRGLMVARTAPAEQQSRAGRLLQPRADAESGPIPPRILV